MEAVNGVSEVDKGGPPPPSPLTGCYLLIVIGEPHCNDHKDIILQKVAKGLLSWDVNDCLVDLEKELAIITEQALEGEEARYGERLIQFASENLVTEILIHPVVSTLAQCVRNLLSSFTRHRHIIHAGYTFANNGSWILQDGTFSLADFAEAFQEIEVLRVIRAYENGISLHIHCAPEGDWTRLPKEPFTKSCKVRVNPNDVLTAGSPLISNFINYLQPFLIPAELETILESSDVVGNIRFSRPTLYVFPGGQGDAALFGINGFNMLLDGGFSRKACFWDFVRHLDRLDAVLLTRLNNSNVNGISAVLRRKKQNAVYPQIGHFFCNIQERKAILSPDGDKDKDPLLINLLEEGQEIVSNLRHLSLTPQVCYRDSEPINLYHKVGHGTLDMYVLSPAKDSKEVREFLQKWNNNDQKLFANQKSIRDFVFPLQNLVSICALLVWQPANPEDTITRILFPGSSPQNKIFEGLDKIKNLEFIKHPVCSEKSLVPVSVIKSKQSVLDKILLSDKKPPPSTNENKKEKIKPESIENDKNDSIGNGEAQVEKIVKKSDSTESEKSVSKPKKLIENGSTDKSDKLKPKPKDSKPKARSDSQQRKLKSVEKKPSPTTPKKTVEKVNGEPPKPKLKASPSATPAKSTKEANNRKVLESKIQKSAPARKDPTPKPAPKDAKPERKPISRRPKDAPKAAVTTASPSKKINGVQKPDSISKRNKLDKEGTTDSSTVSTPSADQDNSILKKDISKLTPEELQNLKAQELADLKEEQEAVKEIEAVFRKSEQQQENPSDFRKIKDLSIDDKLESEEYLIIEKTEVEQELNNDTKEDETQKMARDSEESEKQRKLSSEIQSKEADIEENRVEIESEVQKIITSASDIVKAKEEVVEASKEVSVTSPEDKIDVSTDKKDNENETKEPAPESLPDEKGSANIESGATTTAPTLPEDERMPLDEIKEDNGDQIIEEKHVKENTKEKDVPVIQLPPKTFENITKLPPVVGIRLDKQSHIRDIVKTPDEVADLPVHEEVDIGHYDDYHKTEDDVKKEQTVDDEKQTKDTTEIKNTGEVKTTEEKTELDHTKPVELEQTKPDEQQLDLGKNDTEDDKVEKKDTAVILQDLNKKELSKSPDEEKDTDEHELKLKKNEEQEENDKLSSQPTDAAKTETEIVEENKSTSPIADKFETKVCDSEKPANESSKIQKVETEIKIEPKIVSEDIDNKLKSEETIENEKLIKPKDEKSSETKTDEDKKEAEAEKVTVTEKIEDNKEEIKAPEKINEKKEELEASKIDENKKTTEVSEKIVENKEVTEVSEKIIENKELTQMPEEISEKKQTSSVVSANLPEEVKEKIDELKSQITEEKPVEESKKEEKQQIETILQEPEKEVVKLDEQPAKSESITPEKDVQKSQIDIKETVEKTENEIKEFHDIITPPIIEKSETETKEKNDEKPVEKQEIEPEITKPSEIIDQIKAVKEDVTIIEKIDEKLEKLKEQETVISEIVTVDRKIEQVQHAEPVILTADSNPESPMVERPEFDEPLALGRKSPKEREEDVIKIVASVAEVLKSDAPLEEFEGKIPFSIPYKSYTTELRETHITTVDSPISDEKRRIDDTICPKSTSLSFIEEERKISAIHEETEPTESKITKMMKDSEELMKASSKIIMDIKQTQSIDNVIEEEEEEEEAAAKEDDAGVVHRMLVTASSEDGGEETEICPAGTITFSRSSESSGRSSPDPQSSQKASQISSLADTFSEGTTVLGKTVKEVLSKEVVDKNKVEVSKQELTNGFDDKLDDFHNEIENGISDVKETIVKSVDAVKTIVSSEDKDEQAKVEEKLEKEEHKEAEISASKDIEKKEEDKTDFSSNLEEKTETKPEPISDRLQDVLKAVEDQIDDAAKHAEKIVQEQAAKKLSDISAETEIIKEEKSTVESKISEKIEETKEKLDDLTKPIISETERKESLSESKFDIVNGLETVEKMVVDVIMADREELHSSSKETSRKSSTVEHDDEQPISKIIEQEIEQVKEAVKETVEHIFHHDDREDILEKSAEDIEKNYEIVSDMAKSMVFEKCEIPAEKVLESSANALEQTYESTIDLTNSVVFDKCSKLDENLKSVVESTKSSGKSTPEPKDIGENRKDSVISGKISSEVKQTENSKLEESGKSTPDLKEHRDSIISEVGKSVEKISDLSGKSTPELKEQKEALAEQDNLKSADLSGKSTPDLKDRKDSLIGDKTETDAKDRKDSVMSDKSALDSKDRKESLIEDKLNVDSLKSDNLSGKSTPDLKEQIVDELSKAKELVTETKSDIKSESKDLTIESHKIEESTISVKSTPEIKDKIEIKEISALSGKSTPDLKDSVTSGKETPNLDDSKKDISGKSTPDLKDNLVSGKETPDLQKTAELSGKSTPDLKDNLISEKESLDLQKVTELSGKSTPDIKDSLLLGKETSDLQKTTDLSGKSTPDLKDNLLLEKGTSDLQKTSELSGKSTPDLKDNLLLGKETPDLQKTTELSGKSTPDLKDHLGSGKETPDLTKITDISGKSTPDFKDHLLSGKETPELLKLKDISGISTPELKDSLLSGKATPDLTNISKDLSGKSTPDSKLLESHVDDISSGKTTPDLSKEHKDSDKSSPDLKIDEKVTLLEKKDDIKDVSISGKFSPDIKIDEKKKLEDNSEKTIKETVGSLKEECKESILLEKSDTPSVSGEKVQETVSIKVNQSSLASSPAISGKSTPDLKEENKDSLLSGKSSPYPLDVKELDEKQDISIKSDSVLSSAEKDQSDRLTPDAELASEKDKSPGASSELKDSGKSSPLQQEEKLSSVDNKLSNKVEDSFDMTKSVIFESETQPTHLTADQPESVKKLSVSDVEIMIKETPKDDIKEDEKKIDPISMTASFIQHEVEKAVETTTKKEELGTTTTTTGKTSGKSTPDIPKDSAKDEKHILDSSTPPTVPVSSSIKDSSSIQPEEPKTTTTMKTITSLKESEVRSYTPASDDYDIGVSTYSDISSGQVSRAPHLHETDTRIDSDEDDEIPGSPMSVTSQVAHSRSSSRYDFEDERIGSKLDPMNTSFYGALPDEPEELDYEKVVLEHRESRGQDLGAPATYLYEVTKAKFTSSTSDLRETTNKDSLDQINKNEQQSDLMTASFMGDLPAPAESSGKKDPFDLWGKPLGLPSPAPPSDNRGTPKKERRLPSNVSAKNKLNDDRKRSESPSKYKNKKCTPVYVDLTYVPHHGNGFYAYVDFFKRVRARYYVFSGIEPSREVYNALLEAKQTWEDKELEVTIIPTYDTDILGYWVAENEELLTKCKIDLSPSASRCTINLQDHETSCSAYRLEF